MRIFRNINTWVLLIIVSLCLFGCASVSPIITQMSKQDYQANLKLGKELLKEWSYNKGVIDGTQIIISDHQIVLGMAKMTTLAKEQCLYSEIDYASGYATGFIARLTVKTIDDLASLIIQTLAKFGITAISSYKEVIYYVRNN